MSLKNMTLALIALLALGSLPPCYAQGGDGDKPQQVNADLPPDATLIVEAARLALLGESRQSPMLLLAAAELLLDANPGERKPDDVKTTVTGGSTDGEHGPPALEVDALIARAIELAGDDAELKAAVETGAQRLQSGSRGIVYSQGKDLPRFDYQGTTYVVINNSSEYQRIDPDDSYTASNVVFEAQRKAMVVVVGDGDGDLDLWVYDEDSGVLIGKDTDETSVCVVEWTPRYEGPFKIEVRNVGDVWEQFYVLANW